MVRIGNHGRKEWKRTSGGSGGGVAYILYRKQTIVCFGSTILFSGILFFILRHSFPMETAKLETLAEYEIQLVEQRAQQELQKVRGRINTSHQEAILDGTDRSQQQQQQQNNNNNQSPNEAAAAALVVENHPVQLVGKSQSKISQEICPYTSMHDLSAMERYPVASSSRHMITPPMETQDYGVTLVCCSTTQGPLSILVHHAWAPYGARRFLDLVETHYFDTSIPFMRCVPNFLCQFGLNGIPTVMNEFAHSIPDDPNWLPEGKTYRENEYGVKRFQRGYLAYAGAGRNTRSLQLIVALQDNGPLAGGSPWEVPWGELVGDYSYQTLDRIYTGYGEQGPKQGSLWKADALIKIRKNFPKLDYITSCHVVDRYGGQGVPMSTRKNS